MSHKINPRTGTVPRYRSSSTYRKPLNTYKPAPSPPVEPVKQRVNGLRELKPTLTQEEVDRLARQMIGLLMEEIKPLLEKIEQQNQQVETPKKTKKKGKTSKSRSNK